MCGTTSQERQVALFTLLTKELTHGDYRGFLDDSARVPADAPKDGSVAVDPLGDGSVPTDLFARGETSSDLACPALAATVAYLARNPDGVRDRLCLGEWLPFYGFDPDDDVAPSDKRDLGYGPSAFPGTP